MANFELFRAFQDGMVLQRDGEVNIWGFAGNGVRVKVQLDDKEYEAVTDEDGVFEVSVYTGKAGGPHTMKVYNSTGVVEIGDILYGDVYIISGQSNMQLTIDRTIDLIGERLDSIDYPMIREFRVPEIMKFGEVTGQLPECRWYKATSEDIMLMSATGFNFAENVYLKENVPIGLINNSIGGTPIESHLPEEVLREIGGYDEVIDQCLDKKYVEDTMKADMDCMNEWYTRLYQSDKGYGHGKAGNENNVQCSDTKQDNMTALENESDMINNIPLYASCDYDDSAWNELDIPVFFGDTVIGDYHGSIWFRKHVVIPDNYNIEGVMLRLGTLIDQDEVYVNGVKAGETAYMYPPRRYPVPDGVLRHGDNVITIRLVINRNTGGFTWGKKYCLQGNAYIFEGGYTDKAVISEHACSDDEFFDNVLLDSEYNAQFNTQYNAYINEYDNKHNDGQDNEYIDGMTKGDLHGKNTWNTYVPESGIWELDISGTWKYAYGAAMETLPLQTFFIYKPSALYNGMMYPVKRYTCIAGLWYQGESNDIKPEGYSVLMEKLIDCWREWFGEKLPFIYAGLPQYDDPACVVEKDSWAVIREEQRKVLYSRSNTAMAVTIDIGEANDLHPQTKGAVGKRLALAAEALVYGRDVEYSGPQPDSIEYSEDDNTIRIRFKHCSGGMKMINHNRYFEVGYMSAPDNTDKSEETSGNDNTGGSTCRYSMSETYITEDMNIGENGSIAPITWIALNKEDVRIAGDNEIVIKASGNGACDTNNRPVAVRYCYSNCPLDPPIYNGAGLPMMPFVLYT